MTDARKYYVYVLLDPRREGVFKYGKWKFNHEPFYVGKGTGDRAVCHFRAFRNKNAAHIKHNALKNSRIESIFNETGKEPIICYKRTDLTEAEAYEIEVKLIATMKRMRYGGPLLNLSTGGAVATDVERKPLSEKTKKKVSEGIKKTFTEMEPERYSEMHKKKGVTQSASWEAKGADARKEHFGKISQVGWTGENAETNRAKVAENAKAAHSQFANLDPLAKAKRVAQMRIGYSLSRFKGTLTDKRKLQLKEILMSFVKTSRHRSPVTFKEAFKALCMRHGLSS